MQETPVLDRRYWRERASDLLPGRTPREIVRAAHLLREQYDSPTVTYDAIGSTLPTWIYGAGIPKPSQAGDDPRDVKPVTLAAPYLTVVPDARQFDGREGGGVPAFTSAPDAWSAIKSSMGGDGKVRRRGSARVQGDGAVTVAGDLPNGSTPSLLWQILDDLHRNSVGAIGWQVSIVTDLFYGAVIPAQLGHDTLQSGEHVPRDVDLSMVRGVVRGDSGGNDKHLSWPLRTRLPRVVLRKSEQVYCQPGALVAPASDPSKLFVGHRCWTRGKLAGRKPRGGKLAARTVFVGTAIAVESPAALATLVENVNRGERVALRFNGLAVTITRGKGPAGTYSVTTPRGKANGLRTPQNVARRAYELVS